MLRVWEYTGHARRGYFVKGLPGMQFVREEDYGRVRLQLDAEETAAIWLPAADPVQMWGGVLEHEPGRAFTRVPGTAVCLKNGRVIAVMEKNGQTLRMFEAGYAAEALAAFVRDHGNKRIFCDKDKITVKAYAPELAEPLRAVGFTRVMLDYVLYR